MYKNIWFDFKDLHKLLFVLNYEHSEKYYADFVSKI